MSRSKSPRTIPLPELVEPEPLDPDVAVQMALDLDDEKRKWLRTIFPFIFNDRPAPAHEVTDMARDLVVMAACERARRILQSDLTVRNRKRERTAHQLARM